MNRLVAFLLLCLYLPASADASLTAHYCMGKLTGIDLVSSANNDIRCSKCSMLKQDRKGCCHDKQETIKRVKDQLASGANSSLQVPVYDIQTPPSLFPDAFVSNGRYTVPLAHSPPLFTPVSPLLLHCVFRI